MAKYKCYIAKSLISASINGEDRDGFHLRIIMDGNDKKAPYFNFDDKVDSPVIVNRTIVNGEIFYTVSVWLKEVDSFESLIYKDWVFTESKENFDKVYGKIIMYKKKKNGEEIKEETEEDLVVDSMPTEHPMG